MKKVCKKVLLKKILNKKKFILFWNKNTLYFFRLTSVSQQLIRLFFLLST